MVFKWSLVLLVLISINLIWSLINEYKKGKAISEMKCLVRKMEKDIHHYKKGA